MREEVDSILYSFGLSDDDKKKYNTVSKKSEAAHFVKRRNLSMNEEFNTRRQEEGEPVDSFITLLYSIIPKLVHLVQLPRTHNSAAQRSAKEREALTHPITML